MGRCFVIQPFDDGGPYDRRYDQVLAPAIKSAGLEPYRVDRDPSADVPIETIETEIQNAAACIADISEDNPNVWYELGYAMAARKDVVLLSSATRKRYPFDIQHRSIIRYEPASPSDFADLSAHIATRLKAILERPGRIQELAAVTRQDETEGLKEHEIAVLVTIMSECISPGDMLSTYQLRAQMEQAGYTPAAAGLAARKLAVRGLIVPETARDYDGEFSAYAITDEGVAWLSEHEEKVQLRIQRTPPRETSDDDIPF